VFYSPLPGRGADYCDERLPHNPYTRVYLRNQCPKFTFALLVICNRCLVLLWWRCKFCTSGFVDDDVFLYWALWRRDATSAASLQCALHSSSLTPLRRCICCVLSWSTMGAKTWRVLETRGCRSGVYDATLSRFNGVLRTAGDIWWSGDNWDGRIVICESLVETICPRESSFGYIERRRTRANSSLLAFRAETVYGNIT